MAAHYAIRYFICKPRATGDVYQWQPGPRFRDLGWKAVALKDATGQHSPFPVAVSQALWLNRILDAWGQQEPQALKALLDAWAKDDPRALGAGGTGLGRCPYIAYPVPGIERARLPADPAARTLTALRDLYLDSVEFRELAPKSRVDYRSKLGKLCAWAGDAPVRTITRPLAKAYHREVYDKISLSSANARIRVLRLLMSFAVEIGWLKANPLLKLKLKSTRPRVRIWSPEEVDALVAAADRLGAWSIGDGVMLALDTGQRRADLVGLKRAQRRAGRISLAQAKTGALIDLEETPRLRARLDAAELRARALHAGRPDVDLAPALLVREDTGRAWGPDAFTGRFAEIRAAASQACPSLGTALFMDLRDTAVTRLAEAGCTIPQICAITGHTLESATTILKHYLSFTQALADGAIAKLVASIDGKAS